jgi:murein L,D-transpeptidase YafK
MLAGFLLAVSGCSALPAGVYQDRPIPAGERIDRLVIHKSDHRMEAWSGGRLLKSYAISIGSGNPGPKRRRGDQKTPEGRYRIDRRFVSKKFHRFLHISYPNEADQKAFQDAIRAGVIQPDAHIGGSIGIHGEKSGHEWLPHKWMDWTQGCIAVDNDEAEELYRAVGRNALVIISP